MKHTKAKGQLRGKTNEGKMATKETSEYCVYSMSRFITRGL